jgi:hypothetical protein
VACIYFYGSEQARQSWYILLTEFTTNKVIAMEELNISMAATEHEVQYTICDNDVIYNTENDDPPLSSKEISGLETVNLA